MGGALPLTTDDSLGFTDLHSHLVPGVDDGARTVEDALEGIGRLWEVGVRTVVTTPHLDGSVTQVPSVLEQRLKEVEEGWALLKEATDKAFPDLKLYRGHEVMLDVPDPVLTDPRVRLAGSDAVLVEWPRLRVPPATKPVLSRLRENGVTIVLAHPERYHGLTRESHLPGEWRKMGALLQVNLGSLVGAYGDPPRKRAMTLLERGWVDLMATDFHGRPDLPLYLDQAQEAFEVFAGGVQFDLLVRQNPARIVMGKAPLPVPPLAIRKGLWKKVRDLLSRIE
jgi:protein-tyrosine phosphatase